MPTYLEASPARTVKKPMGTLRPSAVAKPLEPIKVRKIAACVDGSRFSQSVVAHASRIAAALDAELTLLRVIEAGPQSLPDPISWDLRVREAREDVARLVQGSGAAATPVQAVVIEGDPAEQIRAWVRDNGIDLTVLATHGDRGVTEWALGGTARKLIESLPGSIFLIPANQQAVGEIAYRTVLVPLDGSSHAESVLPLASRLSHDGQTKFVLAHIVPVPEMTETAPIENEARDLRERLIRRNRRVADEYLQRVSTHATGDVRVRNSSQTAGVRAGLVAIIAEEHPDLVVLSAYGRGRRADVPFGSVAGYLIGHTAVPLLIVRGRQAAPAARAAAPIRLPSAANG